MPNAKEAYYTSYISSNQKNRYLHRITDTLFYLEISSSYDRKNSGFG